MGDVCSPTMGKLKSAFWGTVQQKFKINPQSINFHHLPVNVFLLRQSLTDQCEEVTHSDSETQSYNLLTHCLLLYSHK